MKYGKFAIFTIVLISILLFAITNFHAVPVFKDETYINLPILMYHSVLTDESRSGKYIITPKKFEQDLDFLEKHGYSTISAKQLIKYVYRGEPLPDKPIMITFDDGMYNNLEYIVPILEKHNAYAIFSVVGIYTDEYTKNNVVNPTYSYLRWSDINRLSQNAFIEFGNHSYNFHSISSKRFGTKRNKYESSLDYIATFSKDTLKVQSEFLEHCGYKPIIYTYPFGSYSKESDKVLKKAGILISLSCNEGINKITHDSNSLYLLKRYNRSGLDETQHFFSQIGIK